MLPLAVAVLALLAVVVTLVAVGRTTQRIRDEVIHVVEPARNQLYEVQRLLALEEAEQRGGAPAPVIGSVLPPQGSEPGAEQRALSALAPLVQEIGPEATEALADLRASVRQWQAQRRTAALRRDPGAELAYAEALAAADRLHAALSRAAAERRARVAELERAEAALITGMVVLALVSILVLARTGRRQMALVQESRRLSTESERRRQELERVSEEKAQFIRGITHDLKNPLGAIDAYAQLLEAEIKGTLSADERQYVARIRGAVQQVLGTVQDLLELARAEARGIRIERRLTDLGAIARDAVTDYQGAIAGAGLSLEVMLQDGLPQIATDERRVREILGNILSNAIKYTPEGGRICVRTTVRVDEPDPGPARLAVEIEDTGPGIRAEDQERIFEEFQRLEEQSAPGAGVGLAISRRMARLLGGDITVRSQTGKGSTFTLWLPMPAPDPMAPTDDRLDAAPAGRPPHR